MRNHVDDILIIFGLLLLGAAVWQAQGATATLAYAGTVLVILGIVFGWQGRAAR